MTDALAAKYAHLEDPGIRAFLVAGERLYPPDAASFSMADQRAFYDRYCAHFRKPRPFGVAVQDFRVGDVPCRRYVPRGAAGANVLYMHGGGFVVGGLESHDDICAGICAATGLRLVSADYRLAPEHPHPAAFDDALAVAQALAAAGPVVLAGDSAGGTLAAVAAIHARDRGWPLKAQVLITPGTAPHAVTPSRRLFANGFLLDADAIDWFFDHYIPPEYRHDWRFAPMEVDDLDGVAPACVVLAECDPLVDEGVGYADRLRAVGVRVDLELFRGMTHDFIKMGRMIKEAGLAQDAIDHGRVLVGNERVKLSRPVRLGDEILVRIGDHERAVIVRGLSDRRGPAPEAQRLYEETPESIRKRVEEQARRALFQEPAQGFEHGRPTKRDRRRIDRVRADS
jgi:acetyl esterase